MDARVDDLVGLGAAAPTGESGPAVKRAVFRPGLFQYAYMGIGPALVLVAGLAISARRWSRKRRTG